MMTGITNITETEPPEWLSTLDYAVTLVMTGNVITIMLAMGAATYWREVWHYMKHPWECLLGVLCQFGILPAVGFALSLAFRLQPYQVLGVIIVTSSPGGAFSSFFAYWVDGDLALSITMATLSPLLALAVMPFNLWAYSKRWPDQDLHLPYFNIVLSLVFVIVPVVVGMFVRHYIRKWALCISKVCGVLGWVGAVTCGVMLILRYYSSLATSSSSVAFTTFLVPFVSVLVAYLLAKMVCFSHRTCRTVATETACQHMVVATNIMLLSFQDPQMRGQLVIISVMYGVWQVVEVAVAVAVFQLWVFLHREDVTEEINSAQDSSVLISVPVPAHRLTQVRLESLTENVGTPDRCRTHHQDHYHMLDQRSAQSQCGIKVQHGPQDHCRPQCHCCTLEHYSSQAQWDPQDHFSRQENCDSQDHFGPQRYEQGPCDKEETMGFLSYQPALKADQVDEISPPWTPMSHRSQFLPLEQSSDARVISSTIKNSTNYWSQDHDNANSQSSCSRRLKSQTSPCDFPHSPYCDSDFDNNVFPEDLLEWAYGYDSDSPGSPSLSNKGVPNMFPVTENDFLSEEDSPLPYGSPVSSYRRFQDYVVERAENEGIGGGGPDTTGRRSSNENPRLSNPESGLSVSPSSSPIFGFYHNGVRLGQTRQFSTFGRK